MRYDNWLSLGLQVFGGNSSRGLSHFSFLLLLLLPPLIYLLLLFPHSWLWCLHTCAHACTFASICRSQHRTPVVSLYVFLLHPLETGSPSESAISVFQIGWLATKSQQSSILSHLPTSGVKSSHDQLFNVSWAGLELTLRVWMVLDLWLSSCSSFLNSGIMGCSTSSGYGLLFF